MKKYIGSRAGHEIIVVVRPDSAPAYELPFYTNIRNHSPTGFEWGYGGSGPAQLALAILVDLVGEEVALPLYQDFKFHFIANLPREEWILDAGAILEWISKKNG